MRILGRYSFNGGAEEIERQRPHLLREVEEIIVAVDDSLHRTKASKEKTMPGRMLFNPTELNKVFKQEFTAREWASVKVPCEYPTEFYVAGYSSKRPGAGAFREMDFVKEELGIEVQFGKYAFMVYNVCAKMTIFHKLGHIELGVEIVPVKSFADHMSTGVSYFEQFVWDLQARGISDIDIPTLILGIGH